MNCSRAQHRASNAVRTDVQGADLVAGCGATPLLLASATRVQLASGKEGTGLARSREGEPRPLVWALGSRAGGRGGLVSH